MSLRLKKLLLSAVAIVVSLSIFSQRQSIFDWLRLHDYQPPQAIASVAGDDTMTDYARHIFYVNHPSLVSNPQTFQSDCSVSEQTIILGCYHSNQAGIFVYAVTDSRLSGIIQVTSAHEMLHAAYDRLSTKDRNYVNGLLQDYYQHDLHDQRIINTMNSYKKTEPNDVINEMHSVFGTEIANLPAPLEQYYQQYFTSRATVAAFSDRYDSEFTSRETKMKSYEAQLSTLRGQINNEETSLKAEYSTINSDRARLDSLRSSGQTQQYNALIDSFNAEVNDYNQKVAAYRQDVNSYNAVLGQYNNLAGELKTLYQSIDASLPTTQTR